MKLTIDDMKNRCILDTPAGDIVRKAVIAFIILAMIFTFAAMVNEHFKLISMNKPIQVASDGGPIPTCGPGNPCKPTDDSIIRKIITILGGGHA